MKLLVASLALIFLAGCASGPARKKGPSPYSNALTGQGVDSASTKKDCPTNSEFMKLQWKSLVTLAGQCVRANNFVQVDRIANQLAKVEPESPWGAYFLSVAAEANKDMPRAYWMIELALKKAPEDGILLFQRSRLNWSEKNYPLALKDLELAVKYNPSIPDAHVQMGQIQFTLGEMSSAIASFQKALSLDSSKEQAWYGLAEAKFNKKDYDGAYSDFQRSTRLNPKNGMAHFRMAQIQEIYFKNVPRSLEMYKTLNRDLALNRMDTKLPIDLSEKIKTLELVNKQSLTPKVAETKAEASKREPSSKKVSK